MSRAKRWSMTFAAKNGIVYTVNIYDEGWTGSVTTLIPSAVPFETQENNDNNAFIPVRTSTGYLRFMVEDLAIIDEIMCTSVNDRYVELITVSGGTTTVHWQGYMQSQTFQAKWDREGYEIEFPIVSALGILSDMPFTPTGQAYTIGYILRNALTNSYLDFTKWHTPYRTSTHDFLARINDKIFKNDAVEQWVKHVGYNADVQFPTEKISCLEVIESICKYFGWTLYERGTDLYFVSVNGNDIYQYGKISNILSTGTITIDGTETINEPHLPQVMSANNSREFLKGYGYFLISEELGTPSDPVNFDLRQAEPADAQVKAGSVDCFYINYGPIDDGNIKATEDYTSDILASPADNYGCQLVRIKTTDDWALFIGSILAVDFVPAVVAKAGVNDKYASFEAILPSCGRVFSGGLGLSMEVKYWDGVNWNDVPTGATLRLQILWGDKWLQQSGTTFSWTSTESTIFVSVEGGKLHGGYIPLGQSGSFPIVQEPADLFYIPVDNTLTGKIKVFIHSRQTTHANSTLYILSNISLTAYRPNAMTINENTDYTRNLFKQTSDMGGNDVFSQESSLVSAVNGSQSSDRMVLNNALTDALDTLPEEDTVDRMAAMYGQPCEQVKVDVEGVSFLPFNLIRVFNTVDDEYYDYQLISVAINWRDNQSQLQLQKLPIQTTE